MTERWQPIAGWTLTIIMAAFFAVDGLIALFAPELLAEAMAETGFSAASAPVVGTLALGSALLLLMPRTAMLGAIALSGFIGGAICAHVRVADGPNPHFAILVGLGLAVWAGLWLRDARLRALFPLSS